MALKQLHETCATAGKIKYESREYATITAQFLPAKFPNNNDVTTLRTYLCQFCGGWHLTHKPKREYK